MILLFKVFLFIFIDAGIVISFPAQLNLTLDSRRILGGDEVGETRPYMVYLRPAESQGLDPNWLCGGVIIHEKYILTSAACIENVKQFYVVSGTQRWTPPTQTNDCVMNGAKKAIWKCVPKSYVFDGYEFNNMQWMVKDIAVVKVEDAFNFERRIRGCDFIPNKIAYNNMSLDFEKAGRPASIAGWGSTDSFSDGIEKAKRTSVNSPVLLEANVVVLRKRDCKNRWEQRYHHIIDEDMICAKDSTATDGMSALCREQDIECKELVNSNEEEPSRRLVVDPKQMLVHRANHFNGKETRRAKATGGFCENDHGGPLVAGHGKSSVVIGIISACLAQPLTHKCHGPFLYTSVWNNRHLINCAVNKEMGATCRRLLANTNMEETTFNWSSTSEPRPASVQPTPAATKTTHQKPSLNVTH